MNRKGYMLVEIIVASFIAFGIAYFMLSLTIKLKNKNDDLLVETQVRTDQTIIMNKFMKYAKEETVDFECESITIDGNVIRYKGVVVDIVSDYATVGNKVCSKSDGNIKIDIPLTVKQIEDTSFDVNVDYRYK